VIDIEEKLRAIWQEVLGCPTVNASNTLTELGGDSVAAMLCANRVRREFGVAIRVSKLVGEDMTFIRLAELIAIKRNEPIAQV
jgi:acyl carrier protein